MSFVFMAVFTVVSGLVCPLVFDSALHMAVTILAGLGLSIVFWRLGAPGPGGDQPEDLYDATGL